MEKTLRLEQEGILGTVLRFLAVAGLIAWVPSFWASLLHGFILIAIIDTLGYGLVILAAYNKGFGFNAKLTVLVAVSLLIGAVVLFYTGPLGAGYLWLVAAVVLSALFGQTLVVVVSIGISALVMIVWAVALVFGFDGKGSNPLTVGIIGSNLLLICLSLAIVIRLLVDRLGDSILESRSYANRLAAELAETRKIKQDLEQSVEEKDALLRELHHRVRNNMQIVQSLLSMAGSDETLEPVGRRVGALAMVNDLSLTGQNTPRVDVDALFRTLVYQNSESIVDPNSIVLVLLNNRQGSKAPQLDPQLAGLLSILASDILLAMNKTGKGSSVRLGSVGKDLYAEFRFPRAIADERAGLILSSITGSKLAAGAEPDIRIEVLEAEADQGPGLKLSFQAS